MNCLTPRAWRHTASWGVFFCALLTYLLTLEPDASLWDCPEYLVTAALLEIGHPPGNPLWTLTARIFSLFGGSDPRWIAICVNASSAIFTAGAAAILCSVLFIILRWITRKGSLRRHPGLCAAVSAAGALTFAWSDSPWFSAVEAEVYAMSLFLTALTVRLMLGRAFTRDPRRRGRMLLLIVYLLGLSIGVHQLNLLVIPALALIWLFREYPHRVGFLRIIGVMMAGAAAVGLILLGFMPGMIRLSAMTELLCVNRLGLPMHSGVWIFWLMAVTLSLCLGLWSRNLKRMGWQVAAWCPAMLTIGFSVYMLLLVRSTANPPMNEGAPSDIFSLAEYLNRDQYGKTPLFYGRTPHSTPMRREKIRPDGTPDYSQVARKVKSPRYLPAPDGRSYRHFSDVTELIYTPELDMWLPRMTSGIGADISCYGDWAGMTPDEMESVEVSYALDSLDHPVGKLNPDGSRSRERELRPTYLQQLRYLTIYQIGYMYFRYLWWNYAGRQNDRFATGEAEHGNFLTGIPPLDDALLGPQSMLPAEIGRENRGHNVLYMVPLLIGIVGMIWLQRQGRRGRRANLVILLLFLMTGLAIVLYLNQSPREVRERDYSFLGSFWAYALWIGAGTYAILSFLLRKMQRRILRIGACCLPFLLPAWMLRVNYDDHDRSGRRITTDFATNLLDSLEPDAILFTNGDNFTFPLWWAQEVGGIRRDVTIINTAYLATPWYICQLMQDAPGPDPGTIRKGLPMQAVDTLIRYGAFASNPYRRTEVVPTREDTLSAVDAIEALRLRYADPKNYRLPGMLRLPAPLSSSTPQSAFEKAGSDSIYIRSQAVASGSGAIGQRQLAALDIIASNLRSDSPRPVYWLSSLASADYAGFYPFSTRTLHTRRLVYADTLTTEMRRPLLDHDLQAARRNLSGKASPSTRIYADATVGPQITIQRLGLLRLAQRLLKEDRKQEALEVARIVMRDHPATEWEYQICNESEGPLYEGAALAEILLQTAETAGPDSAAIREEAFDILRRERARYDEWEAYYRSLPPRLRSVLTPKHLQFIRNYPSIEQSILNP